MGHIVLVSWKRRRKILGWLLGCYLLRTSDLLLRRLRRKLDECSPASRGYVSLSRSAGWLEGMVLLLLLLFQVVLLVRLLYVATLLGSPHWCWRWVPMPLAGTWLEICWRWGGCSVGGVVGIAGEGALLLKLADSWVGGRCADWDHSNWPLLLRLLRLECWRDIF